MYHGLFKVQTIFFFGQTLVSLCSVGLAKDTKIIFMYLTEYVKCKWLCFVCLRGQGLWEPLSFYVMDFYGLCFKILSINTEILYKTSVPLIVTPDFRNVISKTMFFCPTRNRILSLSLATIKTILS